MIQLLAPSKFDTCGLVQIRWTTRARSAEHDPKPENADSALPPDAHPRKRQDSSARLASAEPHAPGCVGDGESEGGKGSADDSAGSKQHAPGIRVGESDGGADDGDGEDDGEESDACAVCLARAPDCELRPCGHARFCRRCVVETVCTWRQEGPPRCALCRAQFHAIVFLE